MSLYSALYAGVSGLSAQAGAMATVADNINNVNTVGYKGSRADFSSMVTGASKGGNYAAGGVNLVARSLISKNMSLNVANRTTDMGIDGNGFFIVRPQPGSPEVAYTRAGSFVPDKNGNLYNTAGYYLQGWPINAAGNYTDTGNLNALQTVNITSLAGAAEPTSKIEMQLNLDNRQTLFAAAYTAGDMASGAATPQFSRSVDVYDAQGGVHQITYSFIKTAANTWQAEAHVQPATDVTQVNGLLASGTVAFDAYGKLDIAASTPALFSGFTPGWTNGAAGVPITMPVGTSAGGDWTQIGEVSGIGQRAVDGGMLGKVTTVQVSATGRLTAVFESGQTRDLYQLPLATFPNADGLARLNGDVFQSSQDSGMAAINAATAGGSGKILGNKLEISTTDLAAEFTDMIRYQRAYSASSKIITTVDEMLQELSALKR